MLPERVLGGRGKTVSPCMRDNMRDRISSLSILSSLLSVLLQLSLPCHLPSAPWPSSKLLPRTLLSSFLVLWHLVRAVIHPPSLPTPYLPAARLPLSPPSLLSLSSFPPLSLLSFLPPHSPHYSLLQLLPTSLIHPLRLVSPAFALLPPFYLLRRLLPPFSLPHSSLRLPPLLPPPTCLCRQSAELMPTPSRASITA